MSILLRVFPRPAVRKRQVVTPRFDHDLIEPGGRRYRGVVAARPASLGTILIVLVLELAIAAGLAYGVTQGYLAYECSDPSFRSENGGTCAGGLPYPVL